MFFVDLEKKLNLERTTLKKSNDELIECQQKLRLLEIDLKDAKNTSSKLSQDYQMLQQAHEQSLEQIEFDNQRRNHHEKDYKLLQEQVNNLTNKDKQMQDSIRQLQTENERLNKELRSINNEYQLIKTQTNEYEEQIEGFFLIYLSFLVSMKFRFS